MITTFNGWDDVEKKIMKVVNIIELLSIALIKLAGWVHENSDAVKKFLKVLAMIDIGMKLSKPIMGAVKVIGILIKVFGKIGPMFAKIGGILSKIGPLFAKLGGIISKVLIPAIKGVATAFLAWPGPIKMIVTGVFLLIAVLVRLWRTNEDFRNRVTEAWANISEVIGTAVDAIKSKLGEWAGYLKRTWEEAGGELGPFLLLLGQDLLENLKNGIVNGIPMVLEAVQGMREAILEKISELITDAVRWGVEMIGKLVEGIVSGLGNVSAAIDQVKETISTAIQSIITQALDWGREHRPGHRGRHHRWHGSHRLGGGADRLNDLVFGQWCSEWSHVGGDHGRRGRVGGARRALRYSRGGASGPGRHRRRAADGLRRDQQVGAGRSCPAARQVARHRPGRRHHDQRRRRDQRRRPG